MTLHVRRATTADIPACEYLDRTIETEYTWRLEHSAGIDLVAARFRRVRLPRPIRLHDPNLDRDLFELWQQMPCFLVAEDAGEVVGYVILSVRHASNEGWVSHLVADRVGARELIWRQLLHRAEQWAWRGGLDLVTIVLASGNDPGMRMMIQQGYDYRGFISNYFPGGDIGVLFGVQMRAPLRRSLST